MIFASFILLIRRPPRSTQLAFYEPFMNLNILFLRGFLKEDSGSISDSHFQTVTARHSAKLGTYDKK